MGWFSPFFILDLKLRLAFTGRPILSPLQKKKKKFAEEQFSRGDFCKKKSPTYLTSSFFNRFSCSWYLKWSQSHQKYKEIQWKGFQNDILTFKKKSEKPRVKITRRWKNYSLEYSVKIVGVVSLGQTYKQGDFFYITHLSRSTCVCFNVSRLVLIWSGMV